MEMIEQYKSYLQDVGNIGARHENSRRFYLAVPSALFAFLALAGKNGPLKLVAPVQYLVAVVGMILCIVWLMHMQSFQAIYLAKFSVLRKMEDEHKFHPIFTEEWGFLQKDFRYKFLKWIDLLVPLVFLAMFALLLFLKPS